MKPNKLDEAKLFNNSNLTNTAGGARYLGSTVGQQPFRQRFMREFVSRATADMETLAELAISQPQAVYTVLTVCIICRWQHVMHTVPEAEDAFLELDKAINDYLLPAMTGLSNCNDPSFRCILALQARCGGMNLPKLAELAPDERLASLAMTAPLVEKWSLATATTWRTQIPPVSSCVMNSTRRSKIPTSNCRHNSSLTRPIHCPCTTQWPVRKVSPPGWP